MAKGIVYFTVSLTVLIFAYLSMQRSAEINYLPLGDSYTIGTGASAKEAWPVLLTKHLNGNNVKCKLLDNPARNGFTTNDLIAEELPKVLELKPDFVTVLIGANDWVRGVSKENYTLNLRYILDTLQRSLKNKKNILLLNIPDFGVTPYGKNFAQGRNIKLGISEFNAVIEAEASKRGLKVVDLFAVSEEMSNDASLISADGLHPSAAGYAYWEKIILPEALKVFK